MRTAILLLACALGACTDDGGEPAITNIDFHYGSSTPKLDTGAVILDKNDPTKMAIQLGASGVDCGVDVNTFMDTGYVAHSTYLVILAPKMPGTYMDVSVAALKVESRSFHYSGSQGDVTIDVVGDRVTGTLTQFMTESDSVGTISASGTFDVKACF